MNTLTITCETCERHWALAAAVSMYEREAVESRPCPQCGAYTLCCPEPQPADDTPEWPRPVRVR